MIKTFIDLEDGAYTLYTDGTLISNKSGPKRFGKKKKPMINMYGYLVFKINKENKTLHRLLAENFIPNPDNLPQVNHIDGNKLNNNLDNLEWCTQRHNLHNAMDRGVHNWGRKAVKATNRITKETRIFKSQTTAAKILGVQQANIWKVIKGLRPHTKNWKFIDA